MVKKLGLSLKFTRATLISIMFAHDTPASLHTTKDSLNFAVAPCNDVRPLYKFPSLISDYVNISLWNLFLIKPTTNLQSHAVSKCSTALPPWPSNLPTEYLLL